MIRPLLLPLLFAAALLCTALPGRAASDGPPFPLVGWWPPPATDDCYATYGNAHLNVIQVPPTDSRDAAIELAKKHGLSVMLFRPQDSADTFEWTSLSGKPHVGSALFAEQATGAQAATLAEVIRGVPADAELDTLVTLPGSASQSWRADAQSLLDAGMSVVCLQRFWLREAGDELAGFLSDLDACRGLALEWDRPLWGVVQVTEHGAFRAAAESDIRAQAYAYLAAGARGILYYTYWGPSPGAGEAFAGWGAAMADPATGAPLYPYERVKELNREILNFAPVLLTLRSEGLFGAGAIEGVPPSPPTTLLRKVSAPRALLGLFRDRDGRQWALVVNMRHGARRSALAQRATIRLYLAPEVTALVEVSREDGREVARQLDNGSIALELPGGTGALLRLDTSPAS